MADEGFQVRPDHLVAGAVRLRVRAGEISQLRAELTRVCAAAEAAVPAAGTGGLAAPAGGAAEAIAEFHRAAQLAVGAVSEATQVLARRLAAAAARYTAADQLR